MATGRQQKSPYNVKSAGDAVLYLQGLINTESEGSWTTHLDQKEVRFVYDMVSKANSFSDFHPTANQSKWMLSIIQKIKLVKISGSITTSAKKVSAGTVKSKKPLSKKITHASRRSAIAYCRKQGIVFDKSSPPVIDVAKGLFELGELSDRPSKKTAQKCLEEWYKRSQ